MYIHVFVLAWPFIRLRETSWSASLRNEALNRASKWVTYSKLPEVCMYVSCRITTYHVQYIVPTLFGCTDTVVARYNVPEKQSVPTTNIRHNLTVNKAYMTLPLVECSFSISVLLGNPLDFSRRIFLRMRVAGSPAGMLARARMVVLLCIRALAQCCHSSSSPLLPLHPLSCSLPPHISPL